MNIERGVSFNFKNRIDYSPVKIVPEGGAHILVKYDVNNWQRTTPIVDKALRETDPHGVVTLQIGENKTTILNGEVTVPDGASVDCTIPDQAEPIHIEVHRNDSKAMVFDPHHDAKHMHHLEGETPYTAQEFPNPLEPKMKVWEEKSPTYLNGKQLEEILGFNINMLNQKGFLHPRYEENSTVRYYTKPDILRAFLVTTVKKENKLRFWSQIRSSSVSPFTRQSLDHMRQQPQWNEMAKRALTFGVNLDIVVNEILDHIPQR
jgi:hypothetical protein